MIGQDATYVPCSPVSIFIDRNKTKNRTVILSPNALYVDSGIPVKDLPMLN